MLYLIYKILKDKDMIKKQKIYNFTYNLTSHKAKSIY